jgi:hypothetical protein
MYHTLYGTSLGRMRTPGFDEYLANTRDGRLFLLVVRIHHIALSIGPSQWRCILNASPPK